MDAKDKAQTAHTLETAQPSDQTLAPLEQWLDASWLDDQLVTSDELDQELRRAGLDPTALEADAHALINALTQEQESWQARALKLEQQSQRRMSAAMTRRPPQPAQSRQALLAALELARQDPIFGQQVTTFFRQRQPAEASDQELEALLEDLEALRALMNDRDEEE